jgi:hypothetical protein
VSSGEGHVNIHRCHAAVGDRVQSEAADSNGTKTLYDYDHTADLGD